MRNREILNQQWVGGIYLQQVELLRERSGRFESAFNQINAELKNLARNQEATFLELLHQVSAKNSFVRYYFDELKQFAKLRNALVHEKIRPDFYIAEPHLEVVQQIEMISRKLSQPEAALTIATRNVVVFGTDSTLQEVMEGIASLSYSQYPIYQAGVFQGLLTEDGIMKYMVNHVRSGTVQVSEIPVADVLPFEKGQNCVFLDKRKTVFELEEIFEERLERNQKLEAAIITEHGRPDEAPLGLITSWDLIKIHDDK